MKYPITSILILCGATMSLLFQPGCAFNRGHDSVVIAKKQTMTGRRDVNKADAKFLIEMADARMMDSKEGQLAAARGAREDVRAYGQLMVTDQAKLLAEIQALANQEGIVLPAEISNEKKSGLADLQKLTGEKLDQKFMSMITIDHKRDVKQFKTASEDPKDYSPAVESFAAKELPLIESHLEKVEALDK